MTGAATFPDVSDYMCSCQLGLRGLGWAKPIQVPIQVQGQQGPVVQDQTQLGSNSVTHTQLASFIECR